MRRRRFFGMTFSWGLGMDDTLGEVASGPSHRRRVNEWGMASLKKSTD